MATNPFAKYAQGYQADPVVAPADPYKQAAEVRAQQDQANDQVRIGLEQQRLGIAQQEAAARQQKEAQEAQERERKLANSRNSAISQLTRTIDAIDSADDLTAANDGWWTTGRSGALVRSSPEAIRAGSDAETLAGYLNTINANTAFSQIMDMRNNSPTGGGLGGATSDKDLELLQSTIASLNPNQGQAAFAASLKTTRDAYLAQLERLDPEAAAAYRAAREARRRGEVANDENGLEVTVTDDRPADPSGTPPGAPPTAPRPLTEGTTLGDISTLAQQGITLGLSDEAAGVGGYLSGFLTGEDPQAAYVRNRDEERARIAAARERSPILGTAAEFLGGGAAARVTPNALGNISLGEVARQGAGLGAVGGYGYGEGAQGSVGGAIAGAAGGAALGAGLAGAGRGVNALAQRFGSPATAAQREIIDAGQREGVRVLTSDVSPPQSFSSRMARNVGERIPFAGTGGVRAAQQEERVQAVRNILDEFGGANASDAVGAVAADLTATRGAELSRLTAQKNRVIENIPGAVQAPNAIREIDQQIARLNGINQDAYAPVVSRLENFKQVLSSGRSLEQVEGNRKLLGDLFADNSLASIKGEGQKAINAIYDPLRTDMANFIRDNGGRGALARWKNANEKLASMAGELKSSGFKSLLNNAETTPENAANILFGQKPSDMKRLYNSLSDAGKAKAQSAILYRAAERAVDGDVVSPQKFARGLEALDKATGVFFSSADKARIDGLEKLLKATQRASEASAVPATGVQNTQLAGGYAISQLFGSAALPVSGALGLMARAYESAPVRNALLRLGRAPAGTPTESKALLAVRTTLNRFANDNQAVIGSPASRAAADESRDDVRREPVQ